MFRRSRVIAKEIDRKFLNTRNLRKVNVAARQTAQRRFDKAKDRLLEEFNNHKVTMEIEAGPEASNTSGTLDVGNISGKEGNLFSFIGFKAGTEPTTHLRHVLMSRIVLGRQRNVRIIKSQKRVIYEFKALIPTLEEIYKETPMPPKTPGKSWVHGIEKGISGLGYYLQNISSPYSKSGTALQVKNRLRQTKYTPTKYISKMFEDFKKRIRRGRI